MALWVVRAGKYGENETHALDTNYVVIGWEDIGDISNVATRDGLAQLIRKTYPDEKEGRLAQWVGQVWNFREGIVDDDLAVLPLKSQSAVAIGRVTGWYEFDPDGPEDGKHRRSIVWIKKDIPRNNFDEDILFSFGSLLTVFRVSRNDAENRVRAMLEEGVPEADAGDRETDTTMDDPVGAFNVEEITADQIQQFLGRRFVGHDLARLVAELLKVGGYTVNVSQPGPDGGVDILAGQGAMGFEPPRLCVQVKSGKTPVDVNVYRSLKGVLTDFGAEQGLLVSWGGFNRNVMKEARRDFFSIRLWDAGGLVQELFENYEKLPEGIRAELPLKRIWTLATEASDA